MRSAMDDLKGLMTVLLALLAMAVIGWHAGTQAQTTGQPDLSAIPQQCIDGGTAVQTYCNATFTAAQEFFQAPNGSEPGNVTQEQIDAFIKRAPPPSTECCTAACDFNAAYCSCEQSVLDFAVQVSGNDPKIYQSIATGFADQCKFKLYLGPTCPPVAERATPAAGVCTTKPGR
eukprot:GHRR01001052.1.p1 GENE.GHRR01001052.1~~GHRR01001052.1.p1  ORF type:complete len:174 (+),score=51.65 GHRR01001052.1:160-681(+)